MMTQSLFAALPPWVPAARDIDIAALGVFAIFAMLVALLRRVTPKVGAVAWVTTKEAIYQPLFIILLLVGLTALFFFPFIPYYTLGDDIRLVITQGLTLVKLLAVFFAIWTASTSIADELDGKTALMVLAKPIGRRGFIIGKFLGVMIAVTILFMLLGTFFLNTIAYKVIHDARENVQDVATAAACIKEVVKIVPGLLLAFLETCILTAIAVAISTRLSLLPNLTISLTVYLLGHLTPLIVQSSVGQLPMVAFVADFISAVLPVLDHFSMETSVAMNRQLPWDYIGFAAVYAAFYCLVALVLSLLLFEDRDVA
ncbi:MAG: ABC transporter permease [Thermoguttaceae bacterium]